MKVVLESVGNPDFGQDPDRPLYGCEPNKTVEVKEAVDAAIANAAKASEVSGKKVKATAKDVKGLKSKTPMARIQEVVDKLNANKVNNVRANALKALLKAIDEKQSSHKLYELFS